MNQNVTCDFVCEWFDFLRTWINCEPDDDHEDDCHRAVDCRINGLDEGSEDDDDDEDEDDTELIRGGVKQIETKVTCFNCDDNFLFFATNTGWIYCFPRGQRQAKGPLYEHHPIKCQIIGIEIPDENVVALLIPNGFIMFNFVRNEIIYSWSIQRSSDQTNFPQMVTCKCIYDNARHRYHVFTGDTFGTIRCHNVIEDETLTIFSEENPKPEESLDHRHSVVQIDVFSPDLLLVSSCFRSLILWKSISDSWSVIQIGRNIRKVCGQYGAVFHRDGNIVIASRPAMHLIKANTTDGSVVQTFKLKNVVPLKILNLFKEKVSSEEHNSPLRSTSTTTTTTPTISPAPSTLSLNTNNNTNVFSFGHLMSIQINDEDYICSWNSHSLLIIKMDGTLLVKEYSSVKIIDAHVSSTRGYRDVIILREDWTLFRIRFLVKRDYFKSKATDYGIGEVLKGTLGIMNLTNLPTQALNSLEGEIKKICTIMSDKIYEGGEKLLNYTSFDQLNVLRRNSSMENQSNQLEGDGHCEITDSLEISQNDQNDHGEVDENFFSSTSPLYIHQKISRKNSVNSRFENDSDKSDENVLFLKDSHIQSSPSIEDVEHSMQSNFISTKDEEITVNCKDNYAVDSDCIQVENSTSPLYVTISDDNETIERSQQARRSTCSEIFTLEGLELTKKYKQLSSSSYASEIKSNMLREGDNIFNADISSVDADHKSQQLVDNIDSVSSMVDNVSSSLTSSINNEPDDTDAQQSDLTEISVIPIREIRPIKHLDWQLAIENTHKSGRMEINRFCASGYSDIVTSTYVWLSCISKGRPKLVYYPDFESLRLPPGNNKSFTIGAIKNKIYLFNDDNELWFREGVDEPGLAIGPVLGNLATRWTKINKPKSSVRFVNLSLCTSDQLGWFCDINGEVWLTKLRTGSWAKIPHDPDNCFHAREVQICPTDSSMVWCINDKNQLFVRAGIFNTRGDTDEHIGGMAWLPVHSPVDVTSIAVTNNSVWILSSRCNRIFKRIGIQPPSSYVGTDWQEIKSPTLINDSLKDISASLNGDIWLLTDQGSIWQVCDP